MRCPRTIATPRPAPAITGSPRASAAYVIYTSGSTGVPKGVLVEQRGVTDLIAWAHETYGDALDRVFVTTSLCFDVSVFEILGPLCRGGRIDVLDNLLSLADHAQDAGPAAMVSGVPSALASLLDHAALPPQLSAVVLAGEALPARLVRRLRAERPGCRISNVYGPTEATVYATAWHAPNEGDEAPPIGRPVRNMQVYVLDAALRPLPPGVTGDLYLAGIGLARGYLDRAGLTAERFVADPHGAPGARMYHTGDRARWRADGMLDYLGRSDHQVKVRGYRIEPGEIEEALVRHAGIADAVVVPRDLGTGLMALVAYVVAKDAAPTPADLRAHLAESLPDYMIPAVFMTIDALPLNANGKLDRAALPVPEIAPTRTAGTPPTTPNEILVAALFADILGTNDIDANTNFFHRGGDSITSLRLVARARAAGLAFTPRDVFRHQTIAQLALAAKPVEGTIEAEAIPGSSLPATPIMHWLRGRGPSRRFAQAVLLDVPCTLTPEMLVAMLETLAARHDALRLRLDADWTLDVLPVEAGRYADAVRLLAPGSDLAVETESAAERLRPDQGHLLEARIIQTAGIERQLLLVLHHLAVDGVSWRILTSDLATLWQGLAGEGPTSISTIVPSYRRWAHALSARAQDPVVTGQLAYWRAIQRAPSIALSVGSLDPARDVAATTRRVRIAFDPTVTTALLERVPGLLNLRINDILLAALLAAARSAASADGGALRIDLEGHGREDVVPGLDIGQTMGWFTSLFPVLLDGPAGSGHESIRALLPAVKETLRAIPTNGVGYGMLRYLNAETGPELASAATPAIGFNYLGRFGEGAGLWLPATDHPALQATRDADMALAHAIEVLARVDAGPNGPNLSVDWVYAPAIVTPETVERLAEGWAEAIRAIVVLGEAVEAAPILTPSDVPLVSITQADLDGIAARAHGLETLLPLTPLQDGVLFHSLYDEKSHDTYIVQLVATLGGSFDVQRLRTACGALVARHQMLRSSFEHHGFERPMQLVSTAVDLAWAEHTIRDGDAERVWLDSDQAKRFDPARPPLVRFALLRRQDGTSKLVLTMHHLLLDGWSIPIVARDLVALYEGRSLPAAVPHALFMEWLSAQDKSEALAHWADALRGTPPLTRLVETTSDAPMFAAVARAALTPTETARVAASASALHVTPSAIVQAAWAILLARLTRQNEVTFGVTISGRPPELAGSDRIVGLLINTLPLRVSVNGNATLRGLCQSVQESVGLLLAHPNVPLIDLQRIAGQGELFDTLCVYESYPDRDRGPAPGGFHIDHIEGRETSHYPLSLLALPGERLAFRLNYRADLFEAGVCEELLSRLLHLVKGLCAEPDRLIGGLTANDETDALIKGRAPAVSQDVLGRFETQVALRPDAIAVQTGDGSLSFVALHSWSDTIAARLGAKGIGAEDRVALLFERGAPLVASLLGVLKAGAAFVPLDPSQPTTRLRSLIETAGVSLLLTGKPGRDVMADDACVVVEFIERGLPFVRARPHPEHPAYVLFTSGTTGTPKGVVVTHRGLANYASWGIAAYRLGGGGGAAVTTSVAFDATVTSLILPLLAGERVVLFEEARQFDLLAEQSKPFSLLKVTPTQVALIAEIVAPDRLASVSKRLVIGGEALAAETLQAWRRHAPRTALVNEYGPTETVVGCVVHEVQPDDPDHGGVAIGMPVDGANLLVLDNTLQSTPVGMPGELYIEGEGLARGYLGRADLTAERFVAAPWSGPGRRMYRTGDLVVRRLDGSLLFLGRTDDQMKVRGHRIEPGEIETALMRLDGVSAALVLIRKDDERQRLVGYIVAPVVPGDWRTALAARVPEFMVPDELIALDAFPLTRNGKIDRAALPAFGAPERVFAAPANPIEDALAEIIAKLLKVDRVGTDESFFALGGDSILSIQFVSRARRAGYVLKPQQIFELQTVKALAAAAKPVKAAAAPIAKADADPFPATPIMDWLRRRGGPIGRYAQSLLIQLPSGTRADTVKAALGILWDRHEMLRAQLVIATDGGWSLAIQPTGVAVLDCSPLDPTSGDIAAERDTLAGRLAPERGVMGAATWFERRSTLLLCLHHLVCDGVSWRILSQDLNDLLAGRSIEAPVTTFRSLAITETKAPQYETERSFWSAQSQLAGALMPGAMLDPARDTFGSRVVTTTVLPAALTSALLGAIPDAFNAGIDDVLLAALLVAVTRWRQGRGEGGTALQVDVEGHGRDRGEMDLTRTIGWFTIMHPLLLAGGDEQDLDRAILAVKEQRRQVPDSGRGYGHLRQTAEAGDPTLAALRDAPASQVLFNYLGRSSGGLDGFGATADATLPLAHVLSVNALTNDAAPSGAATMTVDWSFAPRLLPEADVSAIAGHWHEALSGVATLVASGRTGRSPSDFPLVALSQDQVDGIRRAVPDVAEVLPLAPLQAGLLFHARYDGAASTLYVSQLVLDLDGDLDAARMRQAANLLVARHESLRATFLDTSDARPVQAIRGALIPGWQTLDRPADGDDDREAAMRALMESDRAAGFRLDLAESLVRFALVRHGERRHSLLCTFHHIIIDGWSMPNIIDDLLAFHADPTADRPTPPRRATYFEWLAEQDVAAGKAAWLASLDGLDQPVRLAGAAATGDGPRLQIRSWLKPKTEAALIALGRSEGVTLATVMQVTWAILLGRLTRRDDVVFGITIGGRPAELPGIETSVGLFINTLPLRVVLGQDEGMRDLLQRLQAAQVTLLPHQHLSLTDIQRAVGLGELFDTLLAFENYPLDRAALARRVGGIGVARVWGSDAAHYPLSVVILPKAQTELRFNARADLLPEATVQAIADRFCALLDDLAERPDIHVGALGRSRDMAPFAPALAIPKSIHGAFDTQAAKRGQAIALIHGDDTLSYAELATAANRLAHHLVANGLRLGQPAIVMMPRGFGQVIAMLAVLKAGGFYIPLDEALPSARVADIAAEAGATIALVAGDTTAKLPAGVLAVDLDGTSARQAIERCAATAPAVPAHPLAAAYAIYTSGSTGRPKGVVVTHANVMRLFAATRHFAFDEHDCWTLFHSAAFDFSVWEIWGALLYGGRLVVVPWEVSREPAAFLDLLAKHAVTVLNQTPSAFYQLADAVETKPTQTLALRLVIFGGEALEPERLRSWFERFGTERPRLVNMYGITETTVHVSHLALPIETAASGSPIGHPIDDLRISLLDSALQEVPVGILGEIFVGGGGLARGYIGRPDLTAERFVADPAGTGGERLYRTGDLALRRPDGSLVYFGRSDHQVKIRGFRIELGEIESRLARIDGVRHAAVVAREDVPGHRRLVGYVVMAEGRVADAASLRAALAAYLPDYMVPSTVVALPKMPLTRNGKLDRAALPAPEQAVLASARRPRDEREVALCQLFEEVLGLSDVGIDDEFFALGGDSLLAMRLIGLMRARWRVGCSIRTLFDHPTVGALAKALDQNGPAGDPLERLIALRAGGTKPPLFCVHPGGGLSWVYARLMRYLPPDQPIYALQAAGFADGDALPATIETMAEDYLAAMRTVRLHGPYHVLGWSFGGLVAQAIAARLDQAGDAPGLTALFDAYPVRAADQTMPMDDAALLEDQMAMMGAAPPEASPKVEDAPLRDTLLADRGILSMLRSRDIDAVVKITRNNVRMATAWDPPRLAGALHLFVADGGLAPPFDWSTRVDGTLHRHLIPCRHGDMLKPEPLAVISRALGAALDSHGKDKS